MFRLFFTETERFDVSNESKQTEDQPKQFNREQAYFAIFFRKFWVFLLFFGFLVFIVFFSVCFETVCFGCFASIQKQRVSMFRLNRNKQKTHPNSLKESIFGYFSENFGLFRFVTKQFCLFWLFRYRFETPKLTEIFVFGFTKQTRNRSCIVFFGSNRDLFLFVLRTPYLQYVAM